ncbi:uncharacterized protein LOC119314192 [Triticum dicoccoides]|uniref:Uncharacterized protein n=1 Tax=Triticum turgidum subsp. durum TaxID=4567 RepID=A0A9R0R774_TRITD|nr:uncharacterized protein LOC119314192 [Triticum dicoccoides]XP_044379009.1 uncharacterized protein LOC123101778 [Triticum aestivum]VAH23939.1 unnamed protein product [Triticum turgidum subsp. durum]
MAASLGAAGRWIMRLPLEGIRHAQQIDRSSRLWKQHCGSEYGASVIRQYKEHLYDLIAGGHPDSATFLRNRSLLKDLSTQIEPRPHDPLWRKLKRNKKVARHAAWTGIVLIYALGYRALASGPEIVEYEGYLVTAESLAMIQGYQQAAERVHKQDGYQPIATAE